VLQAYCQANELDFDETVYDQFITNIADQNVKDETGKIKNICGITGNIKAEKFKLNLAVCMREDMAVYKELEECIFSRK